MEQPLGSLTDEDRPDEVLRRYAGLLNARWWRLPLFGPSYHLFADALYWADEAPVWSRIRGAENALRFLWHYRTGLIVEESRQYVEFWQLGQRLFPRWVGFHPSRCRPSRRYKVIYRTGRIAIARCMDKLERSIDGGENGDTLK